MTTQDTPETVKAGSGKVSLSKFDKLIAIILAAVIGVAAVALAMLILAAGLHIGGEIAIVYLVILVAVGAISFKYSQQLVVKFAWLRWPVLAVLLIGGGIAEISSERSGAEPGIVAFIIVIVIVFLYTILPGGTNPAK
jgi:hypothetical protein